jgi:hypothetical protein
MLIGPITHLEVGDRRKQGICKKINIIKILLLQNPTLSQHRSYIGENTPIQSEPEFYPSILRLILIQIFS